MGSRNPFPDGRHDALMASRPDEEMKIAREVSVIFDHMLRDGRSVIEPATSIWTVGAAEELRRRIGDNPIAGGNLGQWDKLDAQLSNAPRDVVLLAAELVFLREHPLRTARPETRREHVQRVLEHLDPPVSIPASMEQWLSRPAGAAGFKPGQSFNGALWLHLIWAATFVREWAGLSSEERDAARRDPWAVQRKMLSIGDDRPGFRNAFQFLAFPDVFEPISSAYMKSRIQAALADRIGGVSGSDPMSVDRDILSIRTVLAQEFDFPFHFWSPGIRELWDDQAGDPEGQSASHEPRPRHYWIYSPGRSASEWDQFVDDGLMAIGYDEIGDLAAYTTREAIQDALVAPAGSESMRSNDSLCLWQFQHEIAVGDVVYAKRGRRQLVGRGEVVSDARFEPERSGYRHVRSVKWTHNGLWEHPGNAVGKTLTDITRYRDYVEEIETLFAEGEEENTSEFVVRLTPESYNPATFLNDVFISEEERDRLCELIRRKKNVILAGPPGVGKTWAAERLAWLIMGAKDTSRIGVVQFHQSYSYEDFMMGYRPTESGGFSITKGPFYRFCEEARNDDRPWFFIIDEINRGNISKIFGELLMLIEADKRGGEGIRLLYKDETFSVPPNVHIIGMMNTADRSLAVLDYALRRRFGFFRMSPEFGSSGYTRWRQEAESPSLDKLVGVVVDLNREIAAHPALGTGFMIGHSYLYNSRVDGVDGSWLNSVIENELIPLLEEYWFDEPATVEEWADKLRNAVA
jgi:5-methylcytosine-specific restriction protein B